MKKFITNTQICLILYCIISGYGIIELPKNIANHGGTSGWIILIIATIMASIATYIITYLQYTFEGKTLYEYSCELVGKYLTYVFISMYSIYFLFYFVMIARAYCETIRFTILTKTPVEYMCILSYIVVAYALSKGINCIARLCVIYGIMNIIGIILINSILIYYGKVINIRPFFIEKSITEYLNDLSNFLIPFLGMETILILPINRTMNKNILKHIVMAIGFIGIIYIYTVEATISVGGVALIKNLDGALYTISSGVDIKNLELLRRPDSIFIFVWGMRLVCFQSAWGYGTAAFMSKMFKNVKYKYIVIIITGLACILSYVPISAKQIKLSMQYVSYLGIVLAFIIPTSLLIITKVKNYDKKLF